MDCLELQCFLGRADHNCCWLWYLRKIFQSVHVGVWPCNGALRSGQHGRRRAWISVCYSAFAIVGGQRSTGNAKCASCSQWRPSFGTNTNLERISDWLTGAIVALTLANIRDVHLFFDRIAIVSNKAFSNAPYLASADAQIVVVFSSTAGFLLGYILTRVPLGILFEFTERRMRSGDGDLRNTITALSPTLEMAKVSPAGEMALSADQLQDIKELADVDPKGVQQANSAIAISRANRLIGNVDAAIEAAQRAVSVAPKNLNAKIDLMYSLQAAERYREAERVLRDLRQTGASGEDEIDIKVGEMFNALYESGGYSRALQIADELAQKYAGSQLNARYWAMKACALGQKHAALIKAAHENPPGDPGAITTAANDAYAAAQRAIELNAGWRSVLYNCWRGVGEDDDLVSLQDDERFNRLLAPQAARAT